MAPRCGPLPYKLLVNAERFGFGPTAAIADFFPYLRQHFSYIAFAGSAQSLDLQRSFDYDALYDLGDYTPLAFEELVMQHDLFFTALNFNRAAVAENLGKSTIIYDPLCWYWPEIPPVAKKEVCYIAQAFHGVKERIEKEKDKFSHPVVVSPIIPAKQPIGNRSIVLLNLGGLQNPWWPFAICVEYARLMIQTFDRVYQGSDPVIILTSDSIAQRLADSRVFTKKRHEVTALLPQVKYALQTPGLSNIYDAAAYQIPTLFLPPANDSQGRQLELLKLHDQVDAWIDWDPMCYEEEQKAVLMKIADEIHKLKQPERFAIFTDRLKNSLAHVASQKTSKTTGLIAQFGYGGAEQVVQQLTDYARRHHYV